MRGRRYVNSALRIAFAAPDGFSLEAAQDMVIGVSANGAQALRFDSVKLKPEQSLESYVAAGWIEGVETTGIEKTEMGGQPAVTAHGKGSDWIFRLAAVQLGDRVYRFILAARGSSDPERQMRSIVESFKVLTPAEADHLFRILRQLKEQGKTVVLITHKLREIMAITDTVSVMRQGTMVATRETAKTTVEELAELMVGRRVRLRVEKGEARPGAIKLAVSDLTVRDARGVTMVDRVSFEVRAGEIVGIAGVAGNGQSELIEAIAGIRAAVSGTVLLDGRPIDVTGAADPGDLRERGLAHVPEDRHHVGLVLAFEENENAILGYHDHKRYAKGVFLDIDAIREAAKEKIEKYDIRPPDCRLKTANFSGGNQQKIVLSREMEQDPGVLVVGQPTRGVDVGAIEFIHKRLIAMRDQGKAVLVVSVELDEIRSLCDRILVMFAGRIVGERGPDATEGELGLLMAGVEQQEAAQ